MSIFQLNKELIFPHPELANSEGILAIGGDLEPKRILLAYYNGIFPWFSEEEPILWWSPEERFVLFPQEIRISKSMKKVIKKKHFQVTLDTCFSQVIGNCADLRANKEGTWITEEMKTSYCALHELGFAHSVEVWEEEQLVGGLYGISIGKCFFGESMFSTRDNASKVALIILNEELKKREYHLIDCQVYTKHLESLGARTISRKSFLEMLKVGVLEKTERGNWGSWLK